MTGGAQRLAGVESQLTALYQAQLAEQQRAQRRGRWLVALLVIFALVGMAICGGLLPALFSSPTGPGVREGDDCGAGQPADHVPGASVTELSQEQLDNATIIVSVGKEMGIPPRGWVVAIATAMQESKLRNLTHLGARNDHDSLGLFQQRPSQGWGTERQILDPRYSARKFYERLQGVGGWETMQTTAAAQRVQRSAFPDAYQKWEQLAIDVVNEVANRIGAAVPQANPLCARPGAVSASGWVVATPGPIGSGFRTTERPQHNGIDVIVPRESQVRAASAGIVIASLCNASTNNCDVDGSPQVTGCGWYVDIDHGNGVMTRYCHFIRQPAVALGERVTVGQLIGAVGSSGNSSGPHLHFEVHVNGKPTDPEEFMATHGAPLRAST